MHLDKDAHNPVVLAIASGKGGVGKTFLSVNLALAFGKQGHRVVLVDADLGGANIESCVGMECNRTLDDFFLQRGAKDLSEMMIPTYYDNVAIIAGVKSHYRSQNPKYSQKRSLIAHLKRLDTDLVLLDLGAGSDLDTLDLFIGADRQLLILDGSRLSLENCIAFLRSVVSRMMTVRFPDASAVERVFRRMPTLAAFRRAIECAEATPQTKKFILDLVDASAASLVPAFVWNRAHGSTTEDSRSLIRGVFENEGLILDCLQGRPMARLANYRLPGVSDRGRLDLAFERYCEGLLDDEAYPNAVPEDEGVGGSLERGVPLRFASPDAPAARAVDEVASSLAVTLGLRPEPVRVEAPASPAEILVAG